MISPATAPATSSTTASSMPLWQVGQGTGSVKGGGCLPAWASSPVTVVISTTARPSHRIDPDGRHRSGPPPVPAWEFTRPA
jgi:hypothetical protein